MSDYNVQQLVDNISGLLLTWAYYCLVISLVSVSSAAGEWFILGTVLLFLFIFFFLAVLPLFVGCCIVIWIRKRDQGEHLPLPVLKHVTQPYMYWYSVTLAVIADKNWGLKVSKSKVCPLAIQGL